MSKLSQHFKNLNPLRKMLIALTTVIACVGPFPNGTAETDDWRILPTVIAPTLMLMLIFVLPLDMTMSKIFMSDADPGKKSILGMAIKIDLILFMLLILGWIPFFLRFFEIALPGLGTSNR